MAYQYCDNCERELEEPTIRETIEDENYRCSNCGHEQSHRNSFEQAVIKLLERVEVVEQRLGIEAIEHDNPLK